MGSHLPAKPAPVALPPRKPMAAVRRVSLFEREIRVGLSSAAIEILFDLASVLSEGAREADGYYGSTMITIELARAAALVSDPCDASTIRRLADLVAGDARVRERARALAAAEADRLAGAPLRRAQFDLRVRESGRHLHIDVELEARWGPAGSASDVNQDEQAAGGRS
ncbi:MAG TPA: hypothetical protein VNO33_08510 [Kofleriaceae bacterium]|nr:hypothetical protein [Kofleriaceae bacterium]